MSHQIIKLVYYFTKITKFYILIKIFLSVNLILKNVNVFNYMLRLV